MPRSARDSDEEIDVKPGRRTRATTGPSVLDSPLRRSSRIHQVLKQNESSPESPLSDSSNVSSTQTARATRKRVGTMDTSENNKSSHPRRNSVSSDVSENTEVDAPGTPVRRTRNTDTLNKARTSKRLTRAGSEAKSPPTATRTTRRTRASSMGPEAIAENVILEKNQSESVSTPVKTRRRASMVPIGATLIEGKEEFMKIPVVALDRALPNVKEEDTGSDSSAKSVRTKKSLTTSKDELNKSHKSINEKLTGSSISAKEVHDNTAENIPSNDSENIETDAFNDNNETLLKSDKDIPQKGEDISTDATDTESSVSQVLSQSVNEDSTKEMEIKIKDVISMKEQDEILSNKENQAANIMSESKNTEATVSTALLQSPKPLSASVLNTSKLVEAKGKSPKVDENLTTKHRDSKELSEITSDTVVSMKETSNNTDTKNDSITENAGTSMTEEEPDSPSNMQKLVVSTDTESLNESAGNESLDKNALSAEGCAKSSSLNDHSKTQECINKDNEIDNKNMEADDKAQKIVKETCSNNEASAEDENSKMDISDLDVKETTVENEKSEKASTSQAINADDNFEIKEEPEGKKEDETNLSSVMESKSSDVSSLANTQSSVTLENNATTSVSQNTENTNAVTNEGAESKSSDAHTNLKDLSSINESKDNVTDEVKNTESSTVADSPAEPTEEISEKGEPSSTSKRKSESKSDLNNEQEAKVSDKTQKGSQKDMEVDDNESDSNAANLFQDIPASEWKEKSNDIDKSSVHSMSTERLENESEAECDLVLVDREAWLAAENMKVEKEKEVFDYDSDDTVVLKARKDSLGGKDEKIRMDVSEGENNANVSKTKIMNTSSKRKSVQKIQTEDEKNVTEDAEDSKTVEDETEDAEETKNEENVNKNKSILKETNEQATPKLNASVRKSVGRKSLSESKTEVTEDSNKSSTDSPLNKSSSIKKGKTPNKSIQKVDNKLETLTETESAKKRKSLNKSKSKESEISETESNNENAVKSAKKNGKRQSLSGSIKKKITPKKIDANSTEESDNEGKVSEVPEKKSSAKKKKLTRNYSTVAQAGSESEASGNNFESDDSQNVSMKLPKFLFAGTSSNESDSDKESDKSIDSDIQREYNLDGKSISKFSDDDVPGDDCRASETESSDPDDDGSDLADFVVDDDEVEEDESDEENEEEEGENEEEKEEENEDEDVDVEGKEESDHEDEEVENKEESDDESDEAENKEELDNEDEEVHNKEELDNEDEKEEQNEDALHKSHVEDEQLLNESQILLIKKTHKLSKSMECSTPKTSVSRLEKFNFSLRTPNVSFDATHKTLTSEACEVKEDASLNKEKIETSLKKDSSLKKIKSKKNVRSLSPESVQLVEKTNASKAVAFKETDINKTTLVPNSETPTTKYLKKDKLNESAPVIKLGSEFRKLINNSVSDKQNNMSQCIDENVIPEFEEPDEQATQQVNDSLKKKLLKVADNILENDQKKRKKRKQPAAETSDPTLFNEDDLLENGESQMKKKKQKCTDRTVEEKILPDKKKKKKATTTDVEGQVKEESYEAFIETRPEGNDEGARNKRRKKKKEKSTEKIPEFVDTTTESQVFLKKKGKGRQPIISHNTEVPDEKLSKKKQKLLSKSVSQDEDSIEKVSKKKKKKKLLPEDVALPEKETSTEKSSKKKKKLSENGPKNKVAAKLQQNVASESDEGPETVAFTKALNEALKVTKRSVDAVKANKEMKKKKQREHVEDIDKETEFKIKKLESKRQMKANKEQAQKKSIKRLPDEVLENLSDIPMTPLKKRKLSKTEEWILPSRSMFNSKVTEVENVHVEDISEDFIPLSSYGSTTEFNVVNLQKIKKQKKNSKIASFRQNMLSRNSRHPVSAYLMYLEKQKASGKDKFCNKPY